jgi:NADH-quinone oxidoreductase subunit C
MLETLPGLRQQTVGTETVYFLEDTQAYRKLCEHLKEEGYDFPQCFTGVDMDYGLRSILHLRRLKDHAEVAVAIDVPYDKPHVPTVTDLWDGVEWHEREAYDLLGIHYDGHPDLRRILLEDDWTIHPLQRRYDTGGYLIETWQPKPWPDWEAIEREKQEAEAKAKEATKKRAEAKPAGTDLTQVRGLNANYAGKLKEQGIADAETLAKLPDEKLDALASALGLKTKVPIERWRDGARALLAEAEKEAPSEAKLAPKPAAVQEDDLTRIEGISKEDEAKLKGRNIKTFTRLAKLNDKAAEKYAGELGFGRRPFEEAWREQAARLMKEAS